MFEKILLPTDGSDLSLSAAAHAVALARMAGAPLLVVYVHEPYPYTGVGAASSTGRDEHIAEGLRVASAAFERVQALASAEGVAMQTAVLEGGKPAEQIVEAATLHGADTIVMASHGRTGAARLLLGSVAGRVVEMAKVGVMIVR